MWESELEIPPFSGSSRIQYLSLVGQDALKERILARVPIEPEQRSVCEHVHLRHARNGWIAFDGVEKPVFERFVDPEERHGHVAGRNERLEFDGRRSIQTENSPEIEIIGRYSNYSDYTHTRVCDYVSFGPIKQEDMVHHVYIVFDTFSLTGHTMLLAFCSFLLFYHGTPCPLIGLR